MPRRIIHSPNLDRNKSLGWLANAWMEFFCVHGPGDVQGDRVHHGMEVTQFIVDCYSLDDDGKLLHDSGFFSRPKGADKSGLAFRFGLFEAFGPCRFLGFAKGGETFEDPWGMGFIYNYAPGEPMGRPVNVPFIRSMATEETQVGNVYDSIYYNLNDSDAPLSNIGADHGLTRINIPGGGQIIPSTASSASKDGGKETFIILDEPLDLETPVATVEGWKTIGTLQIGDYVFGVDGKPILVWGIAPIKRDRPCYRVTFDDGEYVVTDGSHRWMVYDRYSTQKWVERTTEEMAELNWYGKRRFGLEQPRALDLHEVDLPIDPYVLGYWLGDGDSTNATITVGEQDLEEVEILIEKCGYTTKRTKVNEDKAPILYLSKPGSIGGRFSPVESFKSTLRRLNLLGNKHIPEMYLWASREQRLSLLQGLMDSDGYVTGEGIGQGGRAKSGNALFTNANIELINGVEHLIRSLGWRCASGKWNSDNRWNIKTGSWRVSFTPYEMVPFRLQRKAERCRVVSNILNRGIKSIEPVETRPVRCIAVDSDDHLFLVGKSMLPTHNTHLYVTPELRRMYSTVTRNLRKRKKIAGTWFLETTTMFAKGENSVAEETFKLADLIDEGKARSARLLFDHRWGDCEDLSDTEKLREAIKDAYGEAIGWNDLEGIVNEFYDPRASTADSRRFFLNTATSAHDAWLAEHEWLARLDVSKVVADGELVTLGFDGSRKRSGSVTDATALIGVRLSDGHVFELRVWEQPTGPLGENWKVPAIEVEAEVKKAFDKYRVVGFYCDPAKWETYVAKWEAEYGGKLKVKATRDHPCEWWMTGGRSVHTVRALENYHNAILDSEMTHDGSSALTRHMLNARRRPSRSGMQIGKENPDSERKIDAAVAATLAWQARVDALAQNITTESSSFVPRRVY